jgi:hypothetical protein
MIKQEILKLAFSNKNFRESLIKKQSTKKQSTQDEIKEYVRLVDGLTDTVRDIYSKHARAGDWGKITPRQAKRLAGQINSITKGVSRAYKKLSLDRDQKRILSNRSDPLYRYINEIDEFMEYQASDETWDMFEKTRRF